MTRAQRGPGDRWPDDPRANANDQTAMHGRLDGRGADERRNSWGGGVDERRAPGWGAEPRMPDHYSGELRRPDELRRADQTLHMPDRHSGELRRPAPLPPQQQAPEPAPELEPINPYAVVALVAALLGIFPVAIVFGVLAYNHRGGRGLAVSALVLGVLEILGLLGALLLGGHGFSSAAGPARAGSAVSSPAAAVAPLAAAPVTAAQSSPCAKSQASLIGVTTDNQNVVCLYVDQAGAYQWSAPQTLIAGAQTIGSGCDTISSVGRTADGHAVMCEANSAGRTWQSWTES